MKIIRPMVMTDATLLSSDVPENDYTAYSGATTYALGDRVRVVAADVHLVYESLQAANLNNTPASSPAWWLLVGATNRWKMFDTQVTSQTEQADQIEVVVVADGRIDSVTLTNISAASVQVTVTDPDTLEVVYDETIICTYDSGINDWYAYFYEPIQRATDIFFSGLPPFNGAEITVTLLDAGNDVLCGACIFGLSKDIGETQLGIRTGIQDYSIKTTNEFGDFIILERAYAKRAVFEVVVEKAYVDALQKLLASCRATPTVYIGTEMYGSTIIYGFFKDFEVVIAYHDVSVCTIEIEGLT